MKVVFMGTPKIAVPTLENIIESHHMVAAVITQPDQKSGRGMSLRYSPVKETALKYDIPVYQPETVNDEEFLDMIEKIGADVFAVAAYAQKIPDRLLNMSPFGCINMHPSLLPKYRGSGPLRGPILNGDEYTGVTIMKLVAAWDAGDILMQEAFRMDPKETARTLEIKCASLGADLMLKTLDGLEAGTIVPEEQDHSKATYIKQINKNEGLIDFNDSAVYIERLIRSCDPWPSAFTYLEDKTFKIWDAFVREDIPEGSSAQGNDAENGTVVYTDKNRFIIKTGEGYLEPSEVQLEGKKRMTVQDFLRGKRIEQGYRFGK